MNWRYIMLHHSATQDGATYSWDDIERYHRKVQGWQDIGYHFGVEQIEDSYAVLVGRPLTMPGAHCTGMNSRAIGVCFVGNYDLQSPPREMLEVAVRRLIGPLMVLFGIPSSNIIYHRDYAAKSCPGKQFRREIVDEVLQAWCARHAPSLWNGPTGHPV